MVKKTNVPEIRFEGFSGEWTRKDLHQLVDVRSGRDYKHLSNGNIPVYGTGGYMLSVDEALSYDEDAIGIGRKGTIDKPYILKAPFWTVDTLFYCVPKGKNYLDFCYDTFQTIDWKQKNEATGVPSLSKDIINSITVNSTTYTEQTKIGTWFKTLDQLINLKQRKLVKLKNVKKSMLEKMFPREGDTVPEIRFQGFSGEWEKKALGEIVTPYFHPLATPQNGYVRLGIRSHGKGTFHAYVGEGRQLETARMHKVDKNNLIVNITFAWEHAIAITDETDEGKLVSHRFPQFKFNENMVPLYFKYLIVDEKFRHHLWIASPGGAGRNRVLKIDQMLEYSFWTTSKTEQTKIGAYFKKLDNLISLQQKELEKLKQIKSSCLSKMFV